MPDEPETTAAAPDATVDTGAATTTYAFPFDVPADLSTLDDAALSGLLGEVRTHAGTFAGLAPADITDDTITALRACRDLSADIRGEQDARAAAAADASNRAGEAASLAAEVDALSTAPEPEPEPAPAPPEPAVTAARPRPPSVRQVARRTGSAPPALPPEADRRFATMTAAADVPNFSSGQALDRFDQAAAAVAARLGQYPALTASRARTQGSRRPITVYDPESPGRTMVMTQYSRHGAVQFRRDFPAELRVMDESRGYAVAEYAASERRLPGGSLIRSAAEAVRAGRSLTAAAGWCAPSEMIYELCELETEDGILDAPEIQTTRGGWQLPADGGPNFASIYTGIGNAGDTHLTEAEVIADTAKVCFDIPCPDFEDVRLGVDYVCLTGGLLQRRGYPEVVARFSRGAMVALAHKINQGFIADIVAGSGAAVVIPADLSGEDAISGLLSAVDLAVADARYRNRMAFNSTLEVVLPMWVLTSMRAAATRRAGGNPEMIGITDTQIMAWFTERGAVPRFVYDWQDAFSGLATGPGGAAALIALPSTVQFLIYPAGTWVKAVQDVVALDTIYDSTKLATNEYTAIFAEDGWAALQMCPYSRLYTAPVDVSGVVGCCPTPSS